MQLPLSSAIASNVVVLESAGSTNDELKAMAESAPEFTIVLTTDQTHGRGRLGRTWVAMPGKTLAVSVLLKPTLPSGQPVPLDALGWLPLIAGTAMARAVASLVPDHEVAHKWPNDVQIDGLKVCGILTELVPPATIVLGAGLNLELTADELPTPTSTSLALNGVEETGEVLVDRALSAFLGQLRPLYDTFMGGGADAVSSGIRDAVSAACSTVGAQVRVELPGGESVIGVAQSIDHLGRLVVRPDAGGEPITVAAGDVTHLRHA